eukprot:CAMPEP_0205820628 /NCGR_PEP_ID=MMETSP0206-20130828/3286_1 /ASSEMBLY_ACC=CAM_ASM_000279 /TAXON_ID=36767 /ORGANISM="Euplotes focardii, Strain TN1" /LENGTH=73 /DNA_ID=CAMNT_0053115511 /DNA_START=216 /DNA_END=437 /DNA_ORIENTATION=+
MEDNNQPVRINAMEMGNAKIEMVKKVLSKGKLFGAQRTTDEDEEQDKEDHDNSQMNVKSGGLDVDIDTERDAI